MAMASGGGNGPMSDINITPLVDVMLVLLIIFMITAPMMDDKGVELDLPKAEAKQMEVDESKLVMTIDKDRQVFLGETRVPHAKLEEVLVNNARLQREGELYLKADRTIPYGFVVQVMAVVKKAGIPKLGMVTDPAGGKWPPEPETPEEEAADKAAE